MTNDPHAKLRDRVVENVIRGAGQSDPTVRRAAAEGTATSAELQPLIDKIHRHAYRVTDDDVSRLRAEYPDDQLFEIIVSAALGASLSRLRAGLQALDES